MQSAVARCFSIADMINSIESYLVIPEINHFRRGIKSNRALLSPIILSYAELLNWIKIGVKFEDIPQYGILKFRYLSHIYGDDSYTEAIKQRHEFDGYKWFCLYSAPEIFITIFHILFAEDMKKHASRNDRVRVSALLYESFIFPGYIFPSYIELGFMQSLKWFTQCRKDEKTIRLLTYIKDRIFL